MIKEQVSSTHFSTHAHNWCLHLIWPKCPSILFPTSSPDWGGMFATVHTFSSQADFTRLGAENLAVLMSFSAPRKPGKTPWPWPLFSPWCFVGRGSRQDVSWCPIIPTFGDRLWLAVASPAACLLLSSDLYMSSCPGDRGLHCFALQFQSVS